MKINNVHKPPTKALLVIGSLAFAVIGIVSALEISGVTDFVKDKEQAVNGPTKSEEKVQNKTNSDSKKDFIESPDPGQDVPQATQEIELSARQESDNSVTVLTKLSNVASGTCTLTITNGSADYTDTAQVIYQPSFSSCAGFTVERNGLGPGEWSIKLSVTTDTTLEKTIIYKVE